MDTNMEKVMQLLNKRSDLSAEPVTISSLTGIALTAVHATLRRLERRGLVESIRRGRWAVAAA
jgi:DNA-binding transcriptional ArsR family regulator